ncbi:hypothetical protein RJ639_003514 [Escallonia herrerae]|uniref:Inhibitor I9 domain-containing protein n=1 Tax=Escallonia herrerae TaxID=1293975 RepID=A0AA89AX03_9ASTE|nr:hypothetical protein RJ639_003514 [Escallonia herrerae]
MATSFSSKWLGFLLSIMFIVAASLKEAAAADDKKVYIVYLEPQPEGVQEREKQHLNILRKVVGGRLAADRLVYHYTVTFNGFAARLTDKERDKLAGSVGDAPTPQQRRRDLPLTPLFDCYSEVLTRSGPSSLIPCRRRLTRLLALRSLPGSGCLQFKIQNGAAKVRE